MANGAAGLQRIGRRWAAVAALAYLGMVATFASSGPRRVTEPLAVAFGIASALAAAASLAYGVRRDLATGRLVGATVHAAVFRLAPVPVLVLIAWATAPWSWWLPVLLAVSVSVYLLIWLVVEFAGHLWAGGHGLQPARVPGAPALSAFFILNIYALILGPPTAGVAVFPCAAVVPVAAVFCLFAALATGFLRYGGRIGDPSRALPPRLEGILERELTPRERVALGICAVLDALVAAFLIALGAAVCVPA